MRLTTALLFSLLLALPGASRAAGLAVGDLAPDFTLQGSDGQTYKLSDFRGRQVVVIAWFPKAYTKGCTIECKSLAKSGKRIRAFDVTYFMASVDSPDDNKGFAALHKADFPLLSDPSTTTAKAFGVLNPLGLANRWTYYIGKDGRVLAVDKDINPATSAEDMVAELGRLGVARR